MRNPDPDRYDLVGGVPTWELWVGAALVLLAPLVGAAGSLGWFS